MVWSIKLLIAKNELLFKAHMFERRNTHTHTHTHTHKHTHTHIVTYMPLHA
jgi:hypothetical protein